MGRKDSDTTPLKLNISPAGELAFRGADAQGVIPVGTVAELQMINTVTGALAGKYCQEADIDLLGAVTGPPLTPLTWKPIGKAAPFTGEFDGGGKLLTHISVNESSNGAGLFGYLNGSAVLQNIRLESGSVTGQEDTGGIAGGQAQANQNIKIINCSNGAEITGVSGVGGRIGWPQGGAVIAGCRNSGNVSGGHHDTGGIAGGDNSVFTITACYNLGTVHGEDYAIGGIVGGGPESGGGSITACYNHGSVTGKIGGSAKLGGIAGDPHSTNTACYWNSASPTEATHGIGWETDTGPDAGMTGYSGSFPDVSSVSGWETSDDGLTGYWKPGTTGGGQLPKLWWEQP
jgi:hypothetical protein